MRFNNRIRSIVAILTVSVIVSFFGCLLPYGTGKVLADSAEEQFWYSLSSDYYYSKMTDRQKRFYDIVNRECMSILLSNNNCGDITVDIQSLDYNVSDKQEMMTIMRLFYGANPQYFFTRNGYSFQSNRRTGSIVTFTVKVQEKYKSGATRSSARESIRAKLLDYMSAVPSDARPETVEKIIHDKMCLDIEYNYDAYNAGDTSDYQSISSAAAGLSVCNGYALLFEGLMNHFDIPCVYESSDDHAWNIINLHGYWYYVDSTWDDRRGEDLFYKFYNCSAATFASDSDPRTHVAESIYSDYLPTVIYDSLDEGGTSARFRNYSDRYFTSDGKTYFIVNDYTDAYGYLVIPVDGGNTSGTVSYNGNSYTIVATDTNVTREYPTPCPTTAPQQYDPTMVSGFVWFMKAPDNPGYMVNCSNSYHNTDLIDLDIRFANPTGDVSGVYYRVWFNDVLIYTSARGSDEGYFGVAYSGATTVETASGTCLAPGRYTIRFYSGDVELGGEHCTVTADVISYNSSSVNDNVIGVRWYLCNGDTDGYYINTSVIDLDIDFNPGTDYSGIYYQVSYNGNHVYTSDPGLREGYFRTFYSGASTATVNGTTYLAAGTYTIAFYSTNDELLGVSSRSVTVDPAYVGTVQASGEGGVSGFVERLYSVALGRSSDPQGKQDWIESITLGGNTGADVARGFLYSPELTARNLTNANFVRTLYRTFFNREAEETGLKSWETVLAQGGSRQEVIEGFINSTEWANLCLTFGIRSGGSGTPNITVSPSEGTIGFCTRLYTTCLVRNADTEGLNAWADQLANQRDTGTGAAHGFFFSNEFIGQNVSNEEYVNRLYRTFMGREADADGFNAWVSQLRSGVSREEVFNGFSQSIEFSRICASYGIIR